MRFQDLAASLALRRILTNAWRVLRLQELAEYLVLRRLCSNAWRTLRFRKHQPPGSSHSVQMRGEPAIPLRAGRADAHMFHRIFVRDEYRLMPLAAAGLDTVLDLGANVGLFARYAARLARRVIAYEPSPVHFPLLERQSQAVSGIEAVQGAVAGRSGTVRLYRPRSEGLSGVYSTDRHHGGHMSEEYDEVEALTLGDVFSRHGIETCDLLKLDVEGDEYDILYACPEALLRRMRRIHGEYHDRSPEDPRTRVAHLVRFLEDAGFGLELAPHRRKSNHGHFFASRGE